jgi:hypothetical protein
MVLLPARLVIHQNENGIALAYSSWAAVEVGIGVVIQ